MYVKKSWSSYKGKKSVCYHLAEAYRNENGDKRDRYIANITSLPDNLIEMLKKSLSGESVYISSDEIHNDVGDAFQGAGQLALWRAWQKVKFDRVLSDLTEKQRQSVMAMVFSRITVPCSKLALKDKLGDSVLSKLFSETRLHEDTLYEVMDSLYEYYDDIQKKLQAEHRDPENTILLYDTTSTYFEGTEADLGEYGHSKDKRWDRYQIIIGLITDREGLPLAVRVWRGNKHDAKTINESVEVLRKEFNIKRAVFVGDAGMYGEDNLEDIGEAGYDYIISLAWQKKKKLLSELAPDQMNLFDEKGYYEWKEKGVRYVGCSSEGKRIRAKKRRREAMRKTKEELDSLKETAESGRYYHKLRLYEKVRGILSNRGMKDLFVVSIEPKREGLGDKEKGLFVLEYEIDELALEERKALEGKYILQTTLEKKDKSSEEIEQDYRRLQEVERGFRHIKSYLKIRPIHHRLERRIKAHVLICFLAYFLVKWLEKRLRAIGVTEEVEEVIKRWDQLKIVESRLEIKDQVIEEYQWSKGERGQDIVEELQDIKWWRSINAYKRGVMKRFIEEE